MYVVRFFVTKCLEDVHCTSSNLLLLLFTLDVQVLLYGSDTWHVTKTNTNKLQTFINKCLRNALQISWPEMIPNEELWERTGQEQIITEIKRRSGDGLAILFGSLQQIQTLSWNPQGKRKVGRPKQTWRRSVEEELKTIRIRWRSIVTALCSPRNQEV